MGLSVISRRQRNVNWHTVKALDKAARDYRKSPELHNCYGTRDQFFEKKLGHLFDPDKKYGSAKTWNSRLWRCRQVLKNKTAKKKEALKQKRYAKTDDVKVMALRRQFFKIFSKRIKPCL